MTLKTCWDSKNRVLDLKSWERAGVLREVGVGEVRRRDLQSISPYVRKETINSGLDKLKEIWRGNEI